MNQSLLAQIVNPVLPDPLGGKNAGTLDTGLASVGNIIKGVIGGMFIFAFIIAFFYFLTGGISWITSGGDKAKLEEARNKITNALVGLIVVAGAWAVIALVGTWLGFEFTKDVFTIPFPQITK